MSGRVRITRKDLRVGMTVPWDILDLEGRKLLAKGQTLRSEQMLDQLCQYVLFHNIPEVVHNAQKASQGKVNVFDKGHDYLVRIERIFNELEEKNPDCVDKINNLAKDILNLCAKEPDAVLAAVHLNQDLTYVYFHPLQCAYLSVLIARRAGFTDVECYSLAAAAILANVGMRYTQDKLYAQQDPVTDAQQKIIKQHCNKSVDMLREVGFNNEDVLSIIAEHHERCDGSGYPNALKRDDICRGALVLAVTDRYSAMISGRAYRPPSSVKDSLQHLFMDKGHHYEVQFSLLLIKELTVFPPGCFVKLTNGETAIVVYRGKMSPMEPFLKSVLGQNGEQYANPLVRDLSVHKFEIETICPYESDKPLNYGKIWGYV